METFRPRRAPTEPKQLAAHVEQQFADVEKAARAGSSVTPLIYLTVAPTKPQDGLYLSAAGVLGASRGAYRYDSTTGLYTFLA